MITTPKRIISYVVLNILIFWHSGAMDLAPKSKLLLETKQSNQQTAISLLNCENEFETFHVSLNLSPLNASLLSSPHSFGSRVFLRSSCDQSDRQTLCKQQQYTPSYIEVHNNPACI